jgi:hypothetical protein
LAVAVAAFLALVAPAFAGPKLRIETLSNRADLISGGDALVGITLPGRASFEQLHVKVDGRDVTGVFAVRADRRITGLVTGLKDGANVLTARAGSAIARLTIDNHPIGGPVFAGEQIQPWFCTTADNDLGEPLDAQCNAPTKVTYQYKNGQGQFADYDPENPPSDVATTTTDEGVTVPYIVRVESGTMDRGIYQTAVLADPEQPWTPWAPQSQWNHKVYVPFGGSCAALHEQSAPGGVMDDLALSRGFAVTASGLNTLGQNCNEAVSAEALMMQKEHIEETLGRIRYTMGTGGSGGAIQQYDIAASYPGLLDGIMPSASFTDVVTTEMEVVDCGLLFEYFNRTSPQLWADGHQRALVEGHANVGSSCISWTALFLPAGDAQGRGPFGIPASAVTQCGVPEEQRYHPQDNPQGVRCDIHTYQGSIYGYREDGIAKRPIDNVGIQYGLDALQTGGISAEQFVDLNEKIGGFDNDLAPTPERMVADPGAVETAYRAARVADAHQLANVPIIDLRGQDNEEIHQSFYSYTMRARLDAANGTHANQVIWTGAVPLAGDSTFGERAFDAMDRWLAAIEADESDTSLARKVIENKPADVVDGCSVEGQGLDANTCRQALPYYSDPRIVAGSPWTNDVLKCQLRPLSRSDYKVEFTDEEWERLVNAFPSGVCDYRRPGVGQEPSTPWLTFADGPGGRPLGSPPASRRCRTRVRLRLPRGVRRLAVEGRRPRKVRGRRRVTLRHLPAGTVRIRIVRVTKRGHRVVQTRRLRTCG